MLDVMRKSADSPVLKILFVAIVLVFMFWGVGTMRLGHVEMAAKVNDEVISQRQFERTYQRLAAAYQNMGPQAPPAEFLRGQALNQLIDVELLNQEAARLGLEVDEAELRDAIGASPDFQQNGHFDRDLYIRILQQNGFKPSDFEELQRRRMVAGKVQELVRSGVHVSDEETKDRYHFENERLSLRFIKVPTSDFMNDVTLSDDDVTTYFNANQEKYREPERVRIKVVDFRPQDLAAQVTPTDEQVQAYYDAHQEDYRTPEEVRASHILFKLAPDAKPEDKAAARKQADEVLAKAKGGGDFAELAKQYSQDSTAANGGDLGKFGHGVMTPEFEKATFALEPGQISDIVETPFGLHIIKLQEKLPEHTQTLDEARPSIVEALKTQDARQLALKKVEEAHDQLLDGKDLAQIAQENGLSVQQPTSFARNEPVGDLGPRPELVKQAFMTDAGEAGDIVTEPPGYSIFVVDEHIPSAIPELYTVRRKVENDLRIQRAGELAKKHAEELLTKLKTQGDIDAVAAQDNRKAEDSADIARAGGYLPNIGQAPDLKEAAFKLTKEAPVAPAAYDANGDAVIAVLKERTPADDNRFDSEKKPLQDRLQQRAEAAAVQRFVDQLKAGARIQYGQGFGGGLAPS